MRSGLSWLLVLLTYTLVLLAVTALPAGDPTLSRVREKRQLGDQGITSEMSARLGEAEARRLLQTLMAKQGKRDSRALGDQTFTSDLASKLSEAAERQVIQDLMAQAIGKRFGPAGQEDPEKLQASKRQLGDQGVTSALAARLGEAEARQYIKDLLSQAIGKRSGLVAKRSAAEGQASRKRRALADQGPADNPSVGLEASEARKLLTALLLSSTNRAMTEGDMYGQAQRKWRRDPMADFLDRLYEQGDF